MRKIYAKPIYGWGKLIFPTLRILESKKRPFYELYRMYEFGYFHTFISPISSAFQTYTINALYPPPPNLPPAWRTVSIVSIAGRPVFFLDPPPPEYLGHYLFVPKVILIFSVRMVEL